MRDCPTQFFQGRGQKGHHAELCPLEGEAVSIAGAEKAVEGGAAARVIVLPPGVVRGRESLGCARARSISVATAQVGSAVGA